MASKLTLIALALGATLISSACSEQSKPDKVAKNFLDSIYSGNVNHAVKLMYKPKDAAAYEDDLVAQIKSISQKARIGANTLGGYKGAQTLSVSNEGDEHIVNMQLSFGDSTELESVTTLVKHDDSYLVKLL